MNLVQQIRARRNVGRITCATMVSVSQPNARAGADQIAAANGLRALGDGWLEISAQDAHTIAAAVLHRDLAYGTTIMPLPTANELAESLFDLVPEPHIFFTNGEWADAFLIENDALDVSFDPLSDASIDAGVVCVGDGVTAILWAEDDD